MAFVLSMELKANRLYHEWNSFAYELSNIHAGEVEYKGTPKRIRTQNRTVVEASERLIESLELLRKHLEMHKKEVEYMEKVCPK